MHIWQTSLQTCIKWGGSVTFYVFLMTSCASSPHYKIQSSPTQGDLSIWDAASQNDVPVGQTPLDVSPPDLNVPATGDYYVFKISKPGHTSSIVYLPRSSTDLEATVKLEAINLLKQPELQTKLNQDMDQLFRSLFHVQSLINDRQHDTAIAQLKQLQQTYPGISVLYDLEGSALTIKGNKTQAITAFQRSLELNPSNEETRKIIENLRKN